MWYIIWAFQNAKQGNTLDFLLKIRRAFQDNLHVIWSIYTHTFQNNLYIIWSIYTHTHTHIQCVIWLINLPFLIIVLVDSSETIWKRHLLINYSSAGKWLAVKVFCRTLVLFFKLQQHQMISEKTFQIWFDDM